MAAGTLSIDVLLTSDFPSSCRIKVVGSSTSLGAWRIRDAPTLRPSTGGAPDGTFTGTFPVPDGAGLDGFIELKIAACDASANADEDASWTWIPGPNRRVFVGDATSPSADTPLATAALAHRGSGRSISVQETWFHHRDGTYVISSDPYLEEHRGALAHRYNLFETSLAAINAVGGGMDAFSRGWEYYGFTHGVMPDGSHCIVYREWAPGAAAAALIGDFNGWDASKHPCTKDAFGVFTCRIPDRADGSHGIPHDTYLKISMRLGDGSVVTRIPAWIRYAVYDKALNEYCGKYWDPPSAAKHVWKHARVSTRAAEDYGQVPGIARLPPATASGAAAAGGSTDPARAGLRVYEAHVGMGGEEERVFKYREFADTVLPRVKKLGYNCVQLMAIMEHAYYGSFGYHVTSFHAASSRFGTPEDLKYLVDAAHGMGVLIIMDLVHSHAAKNVNDGVNRFDGTDHMYFHTGPRGNHDLWDSRLFDYSKLEVQRFLLSSARFYIEEYKFDGYRFDGVTSMMYLHHGLSYGFSGGYHEYFGEHTDLSAVVYLMLANYMLHSLSPPALTIAEDVSGMPTLCRPVPEGGVGFDYRLAMAIPDKWIAILKEKRDDEWDMANIVFTLTNRRWQEKTIAYAESHDQALVGDKTLAFWLMDKEMYWNMSVVTTPTHPIIDRGMALHKMIRLITSALGGEGYLTFMGNEFGHPEWIDFPREGNGWSYKHCRRMWHLVDDPMLHYQHLNSFDGAMQALEESFPWLVSRDNFVSLKHEGDKMIVFDRGTSNGPLVFIFNFHPTQSFTDYRIGVPCGGDWVVALDSDWKQFGGYERVDRSTVFAAQHHAWNERPYSIQVYAPCRTVQVLKLRTL